MTNTYFTPLSNDKLTAFIDDKRGNVALKASCEIEGLSALIAKELSDKPTNWIRHA